jgi:hypothetical protein
VLEKLLTHFLDHPDPTGFKAQLVAVDRKACALYKVALDVKLKARGLPPEWSDIIISGAQNSEPDVEQFEYPKAKQDDLIEYFKLTPAEWEAWNRERYGEHSSKWRPPLKILIVCDRLLTGFDAPVEQVKRLRELQEIAAAAAATKQEPERLNLMQPDDATGAEPDAPSWDGPVELLTICRDRIIAAGMVLRPSTDERPSARGQETPVAPSGDRVIA